VLATGKPGVIAFTGAYHGLGYGALNATHREFFRSPFQTQLGRFAHYVPFPKDDTFSKKDLEVTTVAIRRLFGQKPIGAILVEPVQGRGGICVPPLSFLPLLRQFCDEHKALLVLDEIYTGFGRTGRWFACEHSQTIPDLICLGKGLAGGFPLSACVGRANLMDAAWPRSQGEALHTSTFLGHPVGCAMALAQIAEIKKQKLVARSAQLGKSLLDALTLLPPPDSIRLSARGRGLMAGLELRESDGSPATLRSLKLVKAMLHRGFILLPEGEHSNVISFTPPLTIPKVSLEETVEELGRQLAR
jgi:4-aminobutyrate aminotransferase-like enzyme